MLLLGSYRNKENGKKKYKIELANCNEGNVAILNWKIKVPCPFLSARTGKPQ